MSKRRVQVSSEFFEERVETLKKKLGRNLLDWPAWAREEIMSYRVKDDEPKPKRLTFFPYGNTGVN